MIKKKQREEEVLDSASQASNESIEILPKEKPKKVKKKNSQSELKSKREED